MKERDLSDREEVLEEKNEEIRSLEIVHKLKENELNKRIALYQNSLSWQITEPLRYVHSILLSLIKVIRRLGYNLQNAGRYPSRREILDFVRDHLKAGRKLSYRKVSIVILNRNGKKYLRKCLDNIKNNINNSNYEIIVVDNASTDGSLDLLRPLSIGNLKLIENKENDSFSKANNKAVNIATGEYVLFLNIDTEPLSNWLNEMLYVMEQDEQVGVVGSKLIYPKRGIMDNRGDLFFPDHSIQHMGIVFHDEEDFLRPVNDGRAVNPFDERANIQRDVPAVTAACMLVRKEAFSSAEGFDERYFYGYEDVDLCLKIRSLGYRIIYCPTSTLFHHESGTQNTEFKDVMKHRTINREVFWRKWHGFSIKSILD